MNMINKNITVICNKYIYKYYTTKLQTLREKKEDEEDRKKKLINKNITIIILTKNNDICKQYRDSDKQW